MLAGLMMPQPLLISSIARHAEAVHGDAAIASRRADGAIARSDYRTLLGRARRLASALAGLGVAAGDRVGTLAWNSAEHVEIYYAVSGMGAVCHTINPRLFVDQIVYIINHAGDRILMVDPGFAPLIAEIAPRLAALERIIWLGPAPADPAPGAELRPAGDATYEAVLSVGSDRFEWPALDENAASSLCYTSGTTGDPKGVLYSQRSTVLIAYAISLPDAFGISATDVVMPVVPMFHVNAWGLPYAAVLNGAALVMPGAKLDGASLLDLIEREGVTITAGVPTVWLGLLDEARRSGRRFAGLKRVIIGGSAAPPAMIAAFEDEFGVEVRHAWGMTETSPIGVINAPTAAIAKRDAAGRRAAALKQGRPVYGIELRVVDDAGRRRRADGVSFGHLQVRGPWVCRDYFGVAGASGAHTADGWFATGDVATLDPDGLMQIVDRSKDVIKSGGEWISSIDVENAAMAHADVLEAAVIGVPDAKWDERPLLIVALRPGARADGEAIRAFLAARMAKWQVPDRVEFIADMPHSATGKILKTELRRRFAAPSGG